MPRRNIFFHVKTIQYIIFTSNAVKLLTFVFSVLYYMFRERKTSEIFVVRNYFKNDMILL